MSNEPARPLLVERANYQPAYRHEEFIVPLLRDAILETLDRHCRTDGRSKRVLDVGCGRQPFRKTLESMGYQYAAIDTQQFPENGVHFIGAIDGELPHELILETRFDLLFCTEVLEHVADWDRAFRNFNSLLAPGGRLLITCPHVYPLHEVPYDFWRPTAYSLEYFARRVHLSTVVKQELGDGWDVLGTVLGIAQPRAKHGGIVSLILCEFVSKMRWIFWLLLKMRFFQKFVSFGPIYISNLIVFERK